jgi:hypothetical protein
MSTFLGINFKLNMKEIFFLTIFFTLLAIYMRVHKDKIIYGFLADHILALGIALIISRVIYDLFQKTK